MCYAWSPTLVYLSLRLHAAHLVRTQTVMAASWYLLSLLPDRCGIKPIVNVPSCPYGADHGMISSIKGLLTCFGMLAHASCASDRQHELCSCQAIRVQDFVATLPDVQSFWPLLSS